MHISNANVQVRLIHGIPDWQLFIILSSYNLDISHLVSGQNSVIKGGIKKDKSQVKSIKLNFSAQDLPWKVKKA